MYSCRECLVVRLFFGWMGRRINGQCHKPSMAESGYAYTAVCCLFLLWVYSRFILAAISSCDLSLDCTHLSLVYGFVLRMGFDSSVSIRPYSINSSDRIINEMLDDIICYRTISKTHSTRRRVVAQPDLSWIGCICVEKK